MDSKSLSFFFETLNKKIIIIFIAVMSVLRFRIYKIIKNTFFIEKNFVMSEKISTFAPDLKTTSLTN